MGGSETVYFYDPCVGHFYYGTGHPRKPHRVVRAHEYITSLGLLPHLEVRAPGKVDMSLFRSFHDKNYLEFLSTDHLDPISERHLHHGLGVNDCPLGPGLVEMVSASTAGTIAGAAALGSGLYKTAINLAGGSLHPMSAEASLGEYVNDVVLATQELLKSFRTILIINFGQLPPHALATSIPATDRVLVLSFHRYPSELPSPLCGRVVSCPLMQGADDATFLAAFRSVFARTLALFSADAIITVGATDGLAGDRLGLYNLTVSGYAAVVEEIKSSDRPHLFLGGPGNITDDSAKAWAAAVAVLSDAPCPNEIPHTPFGPPESLNTIPSNLADMNTCGATLKNAVEEAFAAIHVATTQSV